MPKNGCDASVVAKPIELGSSTVHQILQAHNTATDEVLNYLQRECDAILECRVCRSMFRSLANFIAHKRIYCQGSSSDIKVDIRQIYPEKAAVVLQPTDPETDRKTNQPKESEHSNLKKRKPVRQTLASHVVSTCIPPQSIQLSNIEGVSCAVTQNAGSDVGSVSLTDSFNLSEPDTVTVVHPKDGYPNMNLRQRSTRTQINIDSDFYDDDVQPDDEDFDDEAMDTTFKPSKESVTTTEGAAKALAKRTDCDVKSLRCLTCNARYSSIRTLNFHMNNSHGKQRKFFPCLYCKNVFSQFWGVTRHLKRSHGMTSDGIDRIREKIRARVFMRTVNGNEVDASINKDSNEEPTKKHESNKEGDNAIIDLTCNLCGKEFGKKQYLLLHQVACAKKAARNATMTKSQPKSNKPLLFVCKTCNRAFSMRQNMAQHAVACARKHKLREAALKNDSTASDSKSAGKSKPGSLQKEAKDSKSGKDNKDSKDSKSSKDNKDSKDTKDNKDGKDSKDTKDEKSSSKEIKDGKNNKESREITESNESKEVKISVGLEDADEILLQLSPSDEAKEEEEDKPLIELSTTDTLLQNRPRRNIKPKQFHDGTIRIPEVVKIKQADGSLVYKLREDVEASAVAPPSKLGIPQVKTDDSTQSKDNSGLDVLVQGQSVPLLGPEDEAKIERMINARKLICLKCKKEYGSISNLRRHAVRHLGWRRFKCKLCKFTSYNKSECKTHLRKCHTKETATLLDYGLHPYIIDLGALLDDNCEDGPIELSLSVPNALDEKSTPAASPKTRSRAREEDDGINSDSQVPAQVAASKEIPNTLPGNSVNENVVKRPRGRPRKPELSTPTSSSIDIQNPPKPRGRPRKHPLTVDSDAESVTQDENAKKPRIRPRSVTQVETDSSPSSVKVEKGVEVEKPVDPLKKKEQVNKLEGLVNILKSKIPPSSSEPVNNVNGDGGDSKAEETDASAPTVPTSLS